MNDGRDFASFMPASDDFRAEGGQPLAEGVEVADEEDVIAALRTVYDPEIPVNLYDLGLIYEIDIAEEGAGEGKGRGDTRIEMTLTAPGCPVAGEMPAMVAHAVERVEGVGRVVVELVWDPPWTKERMSEEARLLLDMY